MQEAGCALSVKHAQLVHRAWILVKLRKLALSPVRKVWKIEVSKHHASAEQGCKRVCNAFSCDVFAHMSGTLLKDRYIISYICTCSQGKRSQLLFVQRDSIC